MNSWAQKHSFEGTGRMRLRNNEHNGERSIFKMILDFFGHPLYPPQNPFPMPVEFFFVSSAVLGG